MITNSMDIQQETSSLKSPHWLIPSHRWYRLIQRPLLHINPCRPHATVKHS